MKQKIFVRAIVKSDEKILLLRRATGNPKYIGQFELPGGKLEFGEAPELALKREVVEEVGNEVEVSQLFKVVSWLDTNEADTQHIILVYLVGLKSSADQLTLSSEHDRYLWEKLSDIQLDEVNLLSRVVLADEKEEPLTDDLRSKDSSNDVQVTSEVIAKEVVVYTDGGSRGNPGPSASGFVIFTTDGDLLFEGGKYLGITTNNQAEYQAVKFGLEKALELGARVVNFRMDSLLVTNQLTGVYKIKNRDLWPIHSSIKEFAKGLDKVTFTHVRREFNKDADAMVNKILDQHK